MNLKKYDILSFLMRAYHIRKMTGCQYYTARIQILFMILKKPRFSRAVSEKKGAARKKTVYKSAGFLYNILYIA